MKLTNRETRKRTTQYWAISNGRNYSAINKGGANGILIEWEEVGISDNCVHTMLKIQALTTTAHQVDEGNSTPPKIPDSRKISQPGRPRKDEIWQTTDKHKIYPCAKRACVTLGAFRKSRIGKLQIKGQERKKHIAAYGEETAEEKSELIFGGIDRIIEDSTKTAGLTKTQFKDWKKIGHIKPTQKEAEEGAYQKGERERNGTAEEIERESIDRL